MCPNPSSSSEGNKPSSSPLATTLSDSKQSFTEKYDAARLYIDSLAKPVGSLGTIEDWGARMAVLQQTATPNADAAACLIFAADHGVAKDTSEGGMNCSAYPQMVSRKVLEALDRGIAGASVLSKCNNVTLRVIDVGLVDGPVDYEWSGNVVRSSTNRIKGGTANFCKGNALTETEVKMCIDLGREETSKMINEMGGGATVIMFGEVGIGNTTSASYGYSCMLRKFFTSCLSAKKLIPPIHTMPPPSPLHQDHFQRIVSSIRAAFSLTPLP